MHNLKVLNTQARNIGQQQKNYEILKGTPDTGLKLGRSVGQTTDNLAGYADADYAADTDDRKSSGYLFQINGGTISWTARNKQQLPQYS